MLKDMTLPFDYLYLVNQFKELASPRDKITRLLTSGEIIRIKKGLYVNKTAQNEYLREILSGMLYGPSYISLEYALAYYQMIPEQIKTITCITTQKPKLYNTPLGSFRYQHIRQELFHLGLSYIAIGQSGYWLASPEKAIYDLVYYQDRNFTVSEIEEFLIDNMRIDLAELKKLNNRKTTRWLAIYHKSAINSLALYLKEVSL